MLKFVSRQIRGTRFKMMVHTHPNTMEFHTQKPVNTLSVTTDASNSGWELYATAVIPPVNGLPYSLSSALAPLSFYSLY